MGLLADQLATALAQFEAWGVHVNKLGRLPTSVAALRGFHEAGAFPPAHPELVEAAQVVRDSQEFIEISNALPSDVLRPIAEGLQHAVGGDIGTEATQAA